MESGSSSELIISQLLFAQVTEKTLSTPRTSYVQSNLPQFSGALQTLVCPAVTRDPFMMLIAQSALLKSCYKWLTTGGF